MAAPQIAGRRTLAETKVQAVAAYRGGRGLVTRLADLDLLGPRFVGGHSVWLTPNELRLMADSGSSVAHNPASKLKVGGGIAPISEMLAHGMVVGLGSDGTLVSNQNMFEAMRIAALVSRIRYPYQPESWISARAAWGMATTGSASVLGMGDDIGVIAVGRRADMVLLREQSVLLLPVANILNALVFSETGADVASVVIDGRVVLEEGRVLTVNETDLLSRTQVASEASLGRASEAAVGS